MFYIAAYLILCLVSIVSFLICMFEGQFHPWVYTYKIPVYCILSGGLGGIVYCLRAMYINICVKKSWDKDWIIWYILRPIVSMVVGGVSFLLLKAGLFVLQASTSGSTTPYSFLAIAFISGLNVDKFIEKIEQVTLTNWTSAKSNPNPNTQK
jgi:hypothetical protein